MQRIFSMELAGRTITAETGKYAEQAGGSVLMRCGDTAVLVCATVAKAPRDGVDFLPLSVEFEEKMYSVGKNTRRIHQKGRPSLRKGHTGQPPYRQAAQAPVPQGLL